MPPGTGSTGEMPLAALGDAVVVTAAEVAADLQRPVERGSDRMVVVLEGEDDDRLPAVAEAIEIGLAGVEQPHVGGVEGRLANRAHRLGGLVDIVEQHRSAAAMGRPVLQPHPGFGDDAEGALGADHQTVGAGAGAGAGQAAAFHRAGRGHHAQAFDEIVDMGIEGGEMAAGAGGDHAAERSQLHALGEVAHGEAMGFQLRFHRRHANAALDARGAAGLVDLENLVEGGQVEADGAVVAATDRGLDPAADRGAAAERNDRDIGAGGIVVMRPCY